MPSREVHLQVMDVAGMVDITEPLARERDEAVAISGRALRIALNNAHDLDPDFDPLVIIPRIVDIPTDQPPPPRYLFYGNDALVVGDHTTPPPGPRLYFEGKF